MVIDSLKRLGVPQHSNGNFACNGRAAVITGITVVGAAWLLTYKTTVHPSGLCDGRSSPPDQTSVRPRVPWDLVTLRGASGTFTGRTFPTLR